MTVDESLIELIERAANTLRGMCMDPSIPVHAKEAMASLGRELDEAADRATKQEE